MSPTDDKERKDFQVSDEALKKVQELIEEEEGATRNLAGMAQKFITYFALAMTLFHLYAAVATITTQILRGVHVGMVLFLSFLVFPITPKKRGSLAWYDVLAALISVATIVYMLWDFEEFIYRAVTPETMDLVLGTALMLLVMEAARRSAGWIMPVVVLGFLAYAFLGPWLPPPWNHRGYDLERIVGHMYMTLEGIFGVPIDVSSTYIILFTIFGAILDKSGAGKFYIDFSFAIMGGKASAAGRTVTFASYLMGCISGSGVANTVTLGSVAYPMLAKAGYDKETAGGLLSAGGIGAILCPPVMGAAAFLIAEILKVSYLEIIKMAAMPAFCYYLGIFLMVQLDAKRFAISKEALLTDLSAKALVKRYWYFFAPLVLIVVFMLIGFTPMMAVFCAIIIAFAASFINKETALYPAKAVQALSSGSLSILSVANTCACAGIIVGVVTLTGLGLKFSSIIIAYAQGNLLLTAIFTGLLMWIIGLAVPVTASYIIGAVIAGPALIQLGVPDFAAHMFIFYYAVLSEVSPPTALSPFAAAAITGGDAFKTMMQAWKYTATAFVVPFMFVLSTEGAGLLMHGPWSNIVMTFVTACLGVVCLSAGFSGWLLGRANMVQRGVLLASGLLLMYPGSLTDLLGLGGVIGVGIWQKLASRALKASVA
ncbi:MAG: TRAP transporter fused permease subunit [Desulfarculus sp.]|nr:TRAP transporter fused permease subunit [Desulfarculus sp.]